MNPADWQPTARLRFLRTHRTDAEGAREVRVLQQWFAPDVPGYMRNLVEGEWRDVPVCEETAP